MPRKPRSKFADHATNPPTFKLCNETQWFLTAMNQNCCAVSKFTINKYLRLVLVAWRSQVMDDLLQMHFRLESSPPTQGSSAPIEVDNNNQGNSEIDELSPADKLTNAIAAFGQWFKNNNIADDICLGLVENIRCIAMMFSLIPAPHHCPIPPPCTCPHQADALPCDCLHADDIPTPPPCIRPHCDNEDIPMEPPTPTCAFSEAASQTPVPSHEATTPPPPPAAVATSPAAAASSASAGPRG
ncbi:hypothetical protein P691DRAFT_764802 [Macrolepiota fuliginosa MF-IS2]|uniref:Uncharacterized protein n=1 Tax=Macrolepiota fuliginosa MF-IS2 TaxID=1400762 RepID=A0A9P5X1H1_9AGAR|nr:hypothetical protein P691DRAFT_764802 [Macrolepiota fuliginosa MF-IS2]